jgi:hypothetical protein
MSASGTGPDQSVSSPPQVGNEPAPDRPQVVLARPGMSDVRPIPWDRAEPDADGRRVRIFFTTGVGPCHVLDHVDVRPADDVVVVTLHEGRDPAGSGTCTEIAVSKEVEVVLARPLAGRTVVDGSGRR